MSRVYLYGIVRVEDCRETRLPAVGDANAALDFVPAGPVAALVSQTDLEEVMPIRRHMIAHTKILEEMTRDLPILPCRFGMVIDNPDTLIETLKARSHALRQTLDDIADYIEVGLRVSMIEARLLDEIAAERPEFRKLSASLGRQQSAQVYHARIDLGRAIAECLAEKKVAIAKGITARLAPFFERSISHAVHEELAVLNLACFVRRAQEPALFAEVERIEAENEGRLTLRYVSPAPPYNFVSMNLSAGHSAVPAMRGA